MKHKILPIFLCFVIVFSLFAISSSAADEPTETDQIILSAGTYKFNDDIIIGESRSISLPFSLPYLVVDDSNMTVYLSDDNMVGETIIFAESYPTLNGNLPSVIYDGEFNSTLVTISTYNSSLKWDTVYDSMSSLGFTVDPSVSGYGQTITITNDTSISFADASYLSLNWTRIDDSDPDPDPLPILSSGYYRISLPIDIAQPTWIGDRNTVWYNIRGRVISEESNRALSFYRLGVSYFVNEGVDYGAGVWGIELLADTNSDTNLEILQITFDRNSNTFYWSYNDLVLDSFVGLAIDGEYEVTDDFLSLFESLFEPYEYEYTGNPWYDIIDGVVDALKIDVFGDFSPWDILITFIGISVFIWLLKVLAGG